MGRLVSADRGLNLPREFAGRFGLLRQRALGCGECGPATAKLDRVDDE